MKKTYEELQRIKNFERRERLTENNFIDNITRLAHQVKKLHEDNNTNYNSIVIRDMKNTIKSIEKYNKDLYLARIKTFNEINKDNLI
tara:strand:+ start:627 stop:887 length:261 start_codon:yes stop_codon:yes gene_type:complete